MLTDIVPSDEAMEIGVAIVEGGGHSESEKREEHEQGEKETGEHEGESESNEDNSKEESELSHAEREKKEMENFGFTAKVIGYGYHYLNGISFTLAFILLVGHLRSISSGVAFGIGVWIMMWILPPETTSLGYFGAKTGGPGIAILTLIGHIAFGLVIGYFSKRELGKAIEEH
jgi:hypothetical protein